MSTKPQAQRSVTNPNIGYFDLPKLEPRINTAIDEYLHHKDIAERRLWFNTSVASMEDVDVVDSTTLLVTDIVHHIIQYNRDDVDIPVDKRKPIKLYINSPGGDTYEGFALIDAIQLSKTPVYTYNVGMCASMGFLIYIAGHKRFTFPRAIYLLHDGFNGSFSSSSKFLDTADFNKRHEQEVIKTYVLQQTSISEKDYADHLRVEWYMLPSDAIKLGVTHTIASSIDELL